MNPSSPSAGPQLSAEQRGRSRRNERSRSRERSPQHSSSQDIDESSATVDPQNRAQGHHKNKKVHGDMIHHHSDMIHHSQEERKLLLRSNQMSHRRPRSTSLLSQMKMMKNLEMSLEPPQILSLLYHSTSLYC